MPNQAIAIREESFQEEERQPVDLPVQTKAAVIYCILNTVNGKKYVGFTLNLKKRIRQHFSKNRLYIQHPKKPLYQAIKKYPKEAFEVSILEESDDANYLLNEREIYWIKELNTHISNKKGYNQTFGGEGTLGWKHTKESLANWHKACDNRKLSPEHIEKLRAIHIGSKRTQESKKRMSLAAKARLEAKPIFNKGKSPYYNPNTLEKIYCDRGKQPDGFVKGFLCRYLKKLEAIQNNG